MIELVKNEFINYENGIGSQAITRLVNVTLDKTLIDLKNKIGHEECREHLDYNNILLLSVDQDLKPRITFTDICCGTFKDRLSVLLKKEEIR